ncbi:pyridoxamine 5'-phosphate oxidase family protein [Agromyces larvae]|uniref:Pyridoxamine 5'-phosphate oxidase family protein n=1 Tax=Agromyces larvae TaxID=2929802 RepID=A0ABY4BXL9_9MICO|nr:pyridoxamine 5'-phosphate oxidase family protein [Agromyces larvae]UOE43659.1 pyridoxamine 5'-phosphate oxidase family protein [Agromyces larvae]
MVDLTRDTVWQTMASTNFMVVGMVTARGEARTAGVMHAVHDGRVWFTTSSADWKTRHLTAHPQVSVTVAIPKRVWFLPWIRIPAATITFSGAAEPTPVADLAPDVAHALLHGLEFGDEAAQGITAFAVRPRGDFVTYGVGVSAMGMRDTERARGRVASSTAPAAAIIA